MRFHLGWIEGSVPKIFANFQGYKWDGSGTGVGRKWDGSGTEVGRKWDGSGTEEGRKRDGSGTEEGRKRDGSGTEAGRKRDGSGTDVDGSGLLSNYQTPNTSSNTNKTVLTSSNDLRTSPNTRTGTGSDTAFGSVYAYMIANMMNLWKLGKSWSKVPLVGDMFDPRRVYTKS